MTDQPARKTDADASMVRICDTCGERATFILVDFGASDTRWECSHCHAHRYEPRGAAERPPFDPGSGPD